MLSIRRVNKGSPGDIAGVRPGDILEAINGHPVRDVIDFQYWGADLCLSCTFSRDGRKRNVLLVRDQDRPLGLEFEDMEYRCCGNHCIFCFVDQNPKGLRRSLYFKDEDYRLSFLHGSYVTLTHVTDEDLNRIVEQKLSPLYVSIHATDGRVRKEMLGIGHEDRLLDKLLFLKEGGIEIHGQIVLCPGVNDGTVLADTVDELSSLYPGLRSISVVPVGLTHHRIGLPEVKPVDREIARRVWRELIPFQDRFLKAFGEPFVFLADEFYLLIGEPLPGAEHYGDYWQIENGVGMTRSFIDDFKTVSKTFPGRIDRHRDFVIVTGMLAGPILEEEVMPRLHSVQNMSVEVQPVENRFFGESVTVSGLLTGEDIHSRFADVGGDAMLILPGNCINADGLFLDDLSPGVLEKRLGRPVKVIHDFEELFDKP